jgi:hypothetical protein
MGLAPTLDEKSIRSKEVTMSFGKCGHEKCRCPVDGEDFCSDYCADRADTAELEVAPEEACRCGHLACSRG